MVTNKLTTEEKAIARRVRQAREKAGLSQREVAERLGLSEVGYGHYERLSQPFGIHQLYELSRILSRPITYFLDIPSKYSNDEEQLVFLYRHINDDKLKETAIELVRRLSE